MIGRIHGKLIEKHPPQIVVDVQGVGYEVDVPMSTFYQLPATGAEVTLYTHLVVREDAHQLYGFATEAERHAFRQLLKISGVGARTALSVLSGLSVSDLRDAVSAPGQRPAHEGPRHRQENRGAPAARAERQARRGADRARRGARRRTGGDIINALLALGYNDKEAAWAVKQLPPGLAVADGIRQALRLLSKQ